MRTCNYLKADGAFCESATTSKHRYCYWHLTQMGRRMRAARQLRNGQPTLTLPLLENPFAIQAAIMEVMDAVVQDRIDQSRARLLLRGLQMAMANLRRMSFLRMENRDVNPVYSGFRQDYGGTEEDAESFDEQPLAVAEPRENSPAHSVPPAAALAALHGPRASAGNPPAAPRPRQCKPAGRRSSPVAPLTVAEKQRIVAGAREAIREALTETSVKKHPVSVTPDGKEDRASVASGATQPT